MSDAIDVLVVGAGAAGLSAAYAAAQAGCSVTVVDPNPRTGGQYHRDRPQAPDFRPAGCTDEQVWDRIQVLTRQTVYSVEGEQDHFTARIRGDDRHRAESGVLHARRVVIATGAYDRPLPVPGWDLPGVMSGGGAQALIKGSGVLPGTRIVVAGTGPFLLAVADAVLRAGGSVAAVVEANDPLSLGRQITSILPGGAAKGLDLARYLSNLARHRVPYLRRHRIRAIHGDTSVTGVTIAKVDRDWTALSGTDRLLEADTVAIGYGFTAQLDLALQLGCNVMQGSDEGLAIEVDENQASSVGGVFAAGETTGIGGVDLARIEGLIAGASVARSLGHADPLRDPASVRRTRDRLRAFADALAVSFPLRPGWKEDLTDDTIVCRCEEVTAGRIRTSIDELGARDARAVKLLTRAGMGWCQGRICSLAVDQLCPGASSVEAQMRAATRPIAVPVPLSSIAAMTARPEGVNP